MYIPYSGNTSTCTCIICVYVCTCTMSCNKYVSTGAGGKMDTLKPVCANEYRIESIILLLLYNVECKCIITQLAHSKKVIWRYIVRGCCYSIYVERSTAFLSFHLLSLTYIHGQLKAKKHEEEPYIVRADLEILPYIYTYTQRYMYH